VFLAAYGSRQGFTANYCWYLDGNGDGRVDLSDNIQFLARYHPGT
jgi:hypothetical protein